MAKNTKTEITNEAKVARKQALYSECLRQLKENIENVRSAMEEAQQSVVDYEDSGEESMMDSYREEMQNKRDMFARQLEQANDEVNLLAKMDTHDLTDFAQFGAIVTTDQAEFFVSVSLGQVQFEGKTIFAVSPSAPVFKLFTGKKVGESFLFKGKETKIVDIY